MDKREFSLRVIARVQKVIGETTVQVSNHKDMLMILDVIADEIVQIVGNDGTVQCGVLKFSPFVSKQRKYTLPNKKQIIKPKKVVIKTTIKGKQDKLLQDVYFTKHAIMPELNN